MTHRPFARFAWGVLAYTLVVIVWGGYVRASGSGAGCGDHWPLCNGVVVPDTSATATLVEFAHRLTSGLLGFLVLGLVVWAFRAFPKGHAVRRAAVWTGVFTVTEALVGAGLVLLEYVAYNPSLARAGWMAVHLVNTFALLAALTLTRHGARGGGRGPWRGSGAPGGLVGAALAGLVVLGASGAVTALGDTLVLGGGLDPAVEPVVATLVGLRVYHPLLAVVVSALVVAAVAVVRRRAGDGPAWTWGRAVAALVGLQLVVGVANVYLLAPIPLQMVHLLVTDLIWIGAVLFASEALTALRPAPEAVAVG